MKCDHTVVTTLYLLVAILGNARGDECYRAEFSEDVWSCTDFENKVLKCEPLELALVDEKAGAMGLQGNITLEESIEDGTTMNMDIWKITDIGNEYMYHADTDTCGTLTDTNTPWFPMFDAMKITKCPIAVKSYEIKDMMVNLAHAKNMLTHEMCGDYLVQMSMSKKLEKISCHELGVSVSEYSCDKDT